MNRFKVGHLTVTIRQDTDVEAPFSHGITIYYRNASRYTLGEKRVSDTTLFNLEQTSKDKNGDIYGFPVYALVHGVATLSLEPFSCPWDSGRSGIVTVDRGQVDSEEEARELAGHHVEAFSQYIGGDVYGFEITDEDGEMLDSCWGFYGFDYCKSEATAAASGLLAKHESLSDTITQAMEVE